MSYSLFPANRSEPLNILGIRFYLLAIEPDIMRLVTDQKTAVSFVDQAVKFNLLSGGEAERLLGDIRHSVMAPQMNAVIERLRLRKPVRAHRHYSAMLCDCGHPIKHAKVFIAKSGVLWRTFRSTGTYLEDMYQNSVTDSSKTPWFLDLTTQILALNLPDVEAEILPKLDGYSDEEKVRLVVPYCLLAPGVDSFMAQPAPKDNERVN